MIDQVLRAADGRSLNTLSLHLDQQGETGRDELTALLFSGSKDPDGTCRSFLSRLKAAARRRRMRPSGGARSRPPLCSVRSLWPASRPRAARLRFSAQAPKELPPVTGRTNRD